MESSHSVNTVQTTKRDEEMRTSVVRIDVNITKKMVPGSDLACIYEPLSSFIHSLALTCKTQGKSHIA